VSVLDLVGCFPAFGGKRDVAADVWRRFGKVKQYIEPCCFSAAVLLLAPKPASLEVIGDVNGFVANFWRAVKHQPAEVARWADYPVSHIDIGARHVWLMQQRDRIGDALQDPDWPGDAKVAGWWLHGQCAWIGSGWAEWDGKPPHVSDAGRGVQALGQVPHVSDAGMGLLTSSGVVAWEWLHRLAARLERVRIIHGDWSRTLNHHYGGDDTAVFCDPPYEDYEGLYKAGKIAQDMAAWCRENANLKVALCGHVGDYDLPGWEVFQWSRKRLTYSGSGTKDAECIWFSPACHKVQAAPKQIDLFGGVQ
jgi:DNA adenine methylase